MSIWGYDEDGRTASDGHRVVYFGECREFIKIGYTTRDDVGERFKELATGNPDPIRLIGSIVVASVEDERRLHERFAMFHHRGEWFRKTPQLVNAIHCLIASQRAPHVIRSEIKRELVNSAHPVDERGIVRNVFVAFECGGCRGPFVINANRFPDGYTGSCVTLVCGRCGDRTALELVVVDEQGKDK